MSTMRRSLSITNMNKRNSKGTPTASSKKSNILSTSGNGGVKKATLTRPMWDVSDELTDLQLLQDHIQLKLMLNFFFVVVVAVQVEHKQSRTAETDPGRSGMNRNYIYRDICILFFTKVKIILNKTRK